MTRSLLVAALLLAGCATAVPPPPTAGVAEPPLPEPKRQLIPTVNIADAVGWQAGQAPMPAAGLRVQAFASDLVHPRWLHVLPNGDVLVAETNAPAGKSGFKGLKAKAFESVMKKAGAATPSAERITLLRDADGDGTAEVKETFLGGLHSPFGMALVGDTLYIANADSLVSVPYRAGQTRITATPTKLADLPGKGEELNHHWTKSLLASADGKRLYIGVGSNSNAGENGMAAEAMRAAILKYDIATRSLHEHATGLRNPVGLAWHPDGTLWTVVNERDELGDELVPDYLTSVQQGAFYGWPYSYWGQHLDPRVEPQALEQVARAMKPDYSLGSHVAPLGLAWHPGGAWSGGNAGMVIGLHGSWNRSTPVGYKVVFVPFAGTQPSSPMRDVLSGFLDEKGHARGRPVGIALQKDGAILVADDVGNRVWRVSPAR